MMWMKESMAKKSSVATEIEIFGAVYPVRGDKDPEYLQELAALVDGKMRDISRQVQTVDTGKIAVLAALNLADELVQCRQRQDGDWGNVQETVTSLADDLGKALQE
jgi:cell division protein ZapA